MKTPFDSSVLYNPEGHFKDRRRKSPVTRMKIFKALLGRITGGLHTRDVFQTKNEVCDPSGRSWRFKRGSG